MFYKTLEIEESSCEISSFIKERWTFWGSNYSVKNYFRKRWRKNVSSSHPQVCFHEINLSWPNIRNLTRGSDLTRDSYDYFPSETLQSNPPESKIGAQCWKLDCNNCWSTRKGLECYIKYRIMFQQSLSCETNVSGENILTVDSK